MSFETISYEKVDNVGVLKINRPKALNAINEKMISELDAQLDEIDSDRDLRVLIITGAGEKAFVAGADISELAKLPEASSPSEAAQAFSKRGQALMRRLEIIKFPVIAAVNGFALGGGLELACACDFIFASDNAKLGLPEVTLGLMPGFGGTQRLARFVGLARARELIYTGVPVTAQEAMAIGLVNKVFKPAELLDQALKVAKAISERGPVAVAACKEAINDGYDVSLDKGLQFEADLFGDLFDTDDVKEGTQAFLEKRPPKFQGE